MGFTDSQVAIILDAGFSLAMVPMRHWWVNQNQTYQHEVQGGYLWSPKKKTNGARNPFYDYMREISPGDVIYSFADTFIRAIGIARSHAYEAPKPLEFRNTGAYWNFIGWRVDVQFFQLRFPAKPADHMQRLGPLLPPMYSPLQKNGQGLQGVYLTLLPDPLAQELVSILGPETRNLVNGTRAADAAELRSEAVGLAEWEEHQVAELDKDPTIPETTKLAVVLSRRGQGKFKDNVLKLENCCRVTKVDRVEHLRASHCKPWRDASNVERLDGENGLLLTPSIDHLFDRGFISFENNGNLLVSPVAHRDSLEKMGIQLGTKVNVGSFSQGQKRYLDFHRESVFLESWVNSKNRRANG